MASPLSFNWDMLWTCNYRCPYCWFHGQWEEAEKRNVFYEPAALLAFWERIYRKHGTVSISFTGGEPFLYPGYADFIGKLTQMHRCQIITNLSQDVEPVLASARREHLMINPSFHILAADPEIFIKKALALKEAGVMQCITCMSWPPLIPRLRGYQELFAKHGLSLTLQSFFGEYNGKRYPDSYTDEEKEIIMPNIGSRGGKPFQTGAFSPKGKLCNAGRTYGVIQPDGTFWRCAGSQVTPLGRISDPEFNLLDAPAPCTADVCKCNEWAFLLAEPDAGPEK